MKKIFSILKELDYLMIFLIIILFILVFCYAQLKIFHEDYINFCGFSFFHVITGSMSPTIDIDDLVIVKINNNIKENDIITYKYNDDFVTHRVLSIKNDSIYTKGDANNSPDTPITTYEVVGKVICIIRWSVWKNIILKPQVMFAITVSIIALWIMFFKRKDQRKDQRNINK